MDKLNVAHPEPRSLREGPALTDEQMSTVAARHPCFSADFPHFLVGYFFLAPSKTPNSEIHLFCRRYSAFVGQDEF
jgi:hypothetical protein